MSRQELYAWAGLASAAGIAGYYVLAVIGLPEGSAPIAEPLGGLFIRVIVIAVVVEFVLDLSQSLDRLRIDKDERDRMIEGKGFRNAYYVLVVMVFTAIGHLVVTGLLGRHLDEKVVVSLPLLTLHILVLGVFAASMVNSATRLICYRRGS